jgi:hypothetical protein
VFNESVKQIANRIEKNYYDLSSDISGIKLGMINNPKMVSLDNKIKTKEKKCC